MKTSGRNQKREDYHDLFAEAERTYKTVAKKALLLLAKDSPDQVQTSVELMDIEILKAVAANEKESARSAVSRIVAIVDSWQHTILRPDELAAGIDRFHLYY